MKKNNLWLKYFITEEIFLTDQIPASNIDKPAEKTSISLPDDFEQKSLLLLIRADDNGTLFEKNSAFLNKILAAVNISETKYIKVYLPDKWSDLPIKLYKNGPKKIILFDASVKPEGFKDSLYSLQGAENVQWLIVDKLDDIEKDVNKKKALWASLKKMFKLG